ncbi:sperm-associated antigen 4 protein-like isoform X1 [Tyto alba]|uniref:sperm-associated antigen 4 protein-like isoform X1 n=2 Tax=Tyto alba TaxID=56313 RepID=UPI001C66829F|nr:sperm-associated antigen 4 protein-like isoform X1 [Tyto alba]
MRQRKAPPKPQGAPRARSRRRAGSEAENAVTHSPAERAAAQQGPASCRDSSPAKESLVLTISSSPAQVSPQRYLGTGISTLQEISEKRSRLLLILCSVLIAAIGGACCGTVLPVWILLAKEVPQVLPEQPVGELKSVCVCRNSLALLETEAREVRELREEVARLAAEMSRMKKELQDARTATSAMPLEEDVPKLAWAVKSSAGFTIDLQRLPRSSASPCGVFWFLCGLKPLDTFVQPDVSPGYCWPFQASRSWAIVRLPAQVQPTAISVQHPLKKSSALGDIGSAPRDFTVSGVGEGGEEETLLGSFTYDVEKEPTQTFLLQNKPHGAFRFIRLLINSNWGESDHACIYRVQVRGRITGAEAVGQARGNLLK